jgi:hypothetical protein
MSFQAYVDSIKEKTGMSPKDFKVIAEKKGLLGAGVKAGAVIAWLKEDYGLGHGHAMAIYGTLKSDGAPKVSTDEAVANHFSGGRVVWQPTYERLAAKVIEFGSDASLQAGKSYISLLRSGKKFGIVQVTVQRFDVGIKLKGVEPTDRFSPAGNWNAMVTHRVRLEDPKQVNAELIRWLRNAYERA